MYIFCIRYVYIYNAVYDVYIIAAYNMCTFIGQFFSAHGTYKHVYIYICLYMYVICLYINIYVYVYIYIYCLNEWMDINIHIFIW